MIKLVRHYPIRADEVDTGGCLSLPSLVAFMQDAAAHHARDLNCGIETLAEEGKGWALSKLSLTLDQPPRWGREVVIETWPSGVDRLFAFRDYRFHCNGQEFGSSESSWLIFDLESRRPTRLPATFRDLVENRKQGEKLSRKLNFDFSEGQHQTRSFRVRVDDTDFNGHVNHVRIIQWMLAHDPRTPKVKALEVDFRAEANEGDEISAVWQSGNRLRHYALTRRRDQRLLALARVETE